ncbi:hypothetical protein ACNOYE_14225 [Nannocystaceae bacterium ST9]
MPLLLDRTQPKASPVSIVEHDYRLLTPGNSTTRTATAQVAFDFKGHALEEQRQLYDDKTTQPDWSALLEDDTLADMATAAASLLDAETFSASSSRDALGRVLTAISPDGSEVHYVYDEGGALQQMTLHHRGSETEQTVVGDITYDAKGRREAVVYGPTGSPTSTTTYTYDAISQRLIRLRTVRASDDAAIQSLHYHYDPVGNITDIRDTAQQTVYFDNTVAAAANSYTYDALYRLVEATGREHSSEGTSQRTHADLTATAQPMASDPSAMRRYTQQFVYDEVGNIPRDEAPPEYGQGMDAALRVRRGRQSPARYLGPRRRPRGPVYARIPLRRARQHDGDAASVGDGLEPRRRIAGGHGGQRDRVFPVRGWQPLAEVLRETRHDDGRADLPRKLRDLPQADQRRHRRGARVAAHLGRHGRPGHDAGRDLALPTQQPPRLGVDGDHGRRGGHQRAVDDAETHLRWAEDRLDQLASGRLWIP